MLEEIVSMIGFFDSGLGGLTIMRECMRVRPGSYMYLGDNLRAPYGSRSSQEILAYTTQGVSWLINRGCDLVVLACNTASANALRSIQQEWLPQYAPQARVLGILVPTVEAITDSLWHEEKVSDATPSILIFATPSTVASGAYEREILKRLPQAKVVSQACPELVFLIEGGASSGLIEMYVKEYVQQGMQRMAAVPQIVLLGCTHYALIETLFQAHFSEGTQLLSQPKLVAEAFVRYLDRHPDHEFSSASSLSCVTTGDPRAVTEKSRKFFPEILEYHQILLA